MPVERQRGQAAVEWIGVTVVVTLLLAASTVWLAGALRPPGAPPDAIGRVAAPLGGLPEVRGLAPPPSLISLLGLRPGRRAAAPIGRALRLAGEGVVLAAEARSQFYEGVAERLRERASDLIHDPLGDPEALPDDFFTPRGLARAVIRSGAERAGALYDYARYLRTLPPRTAVLTASRDAGRLTTDVAIDIGRGALRRRIARGRGTPTPPPPDRVPPRTP